MAKILIVDDSPTELHVLTQMLEREGYQTITARDGEEGIEVARSEMPDVILMDVVMPGINGFQATRRLTRDIRTRQIPVIIVSTKGQVTDREWGMRQGAFSYIVKPVEANNLLDQVRLALTLHVD
jgi:twitching motility two-component system response regulator PilH